MIGSRDCLCSVTIQECYLVVRCVDVINRIVLCDRCIDISSPDYLIPELGFIKGLIMSVYPTLFGQEDVVFICDIRRIRIVPRRLSKEG